MYKRQALAIVSPESGEGRSFVAANLAAVFSQLGARTLLVDADLRSALLDLIRDYGVPAIDLMGPMLLHLAHILDKPPIGQPGLYRQLHEDYFKRIEAIEFTVDHDDGRKPHELGLAEIVIVGVSRVGKTPLSMYLSTRGWKVANVPLVRYVELQIEGAEETTGRGWVAWNAGGAYAELWQALANIRQRKLTAATNAVKK